MVVSSPLLDSYSSFSEFLRQERLKRGLSQRELSERAKVSHITVSRIERGETGTFKMKKSVLTGIASALNLPTDVVIRATRGDFSPPTLRVKVCPSCWIPKTSPDLRWEAEDSCFCARCGDALISQCGCGEPILLNAKFCPECGVPYRQKP